MKKSGFSIIEVLVVGALGAVLLTVVFYILSSSAKMASKSRLNRIIDDQSAFLNFELKKNLMLANPDRVSCNDSVSVYSRVDNGLTTIRCDNNRVASVSANTVFLTSSLVRVSNCSFDCETNLNLPVINISYTMSAGDVNGPPEDFTSRNFRNSITVRQ